MRELKHIFKGAALSPPYGVGVIEEGRGDTV